MDREVMHLRDGLIPKYAELVYNGFGSAERAVASSDHRNATRRERTC